MRRKTATQKKRRKVATRLLKKGDQIQAYIQEGYDEEESRWYAGVILEDYGGDNYSVLWMDQDCWAGDQDIEGFTERLLWKSGRPIPFSTSNAGSWRMHIGHQDIPMTDDEIEFWNLISQVDDLDDILGGVAKTCEPAQVSSSDSSLVSDSSEEEEENNLGTSARIIDEYVVPESPESPIEIKVDGQEQITLVHDDHDYFCRCEEQSLGFMNKTGDNCFLDSTLMAMLSDPFSPFHEVLRTDWLIRGHSDFEQMICDLGTEAKKKRLVELLRRIISSLDEPIHQEFQSSIDDKNIDNNQLDKLLRVTVQHLLRNDWLRLSRGKKNDVMFCSPDLRKLLGQFCLTSNAGAEPEDLSRGTQSPIDFYDRLMKIVEFNPMSQKVLQQNMYKIMDEQCEEDWRTISQPYIGFETSLTTANNPLKTLFSDKIDENSPQTGFRTFSDMRELKREFANICPIVQNINENSTSIEIPYITSAESFVRQYDPETDNWIPEELYNELIQKLNVISRQEWVYIQLNELLTKNLLLPRLKKRFLDSKEKGKAPERLADQYRQLWNQQYPRFYVDFEFEFPDAKRDETYKFVSPETQDGRVQLIAKIDFKVQVFDKTRYKISSTTPAIVFNRLDGTSDSYEIAINMPLKINIGRNPHTTFKMCAVVCYWPNHYTTLLKCRNGWYHHNDLQAKTHPLRHWKVSTDRALKIIGKHGKMFFYYPHEEGDVPTEEASSDDEDSGELAIEDDNDDWGEDENDDWGEDDNDDWGEDDDELFAKLAMKAEITNTLLNMGFPRLEVEQAVQFTDNYEDAVNYLIQ